ncbi:unnamed protein product [Zymoseptoria tritici ST99CH_3D1]|uniref:Uncharacterized protein n=1 Tax=Zymoseptoria tritici ST99CH_1E4 TaxID=1276532 RepID=A0A2H1H0S7_ZYMTR|nr:unnamed protein product [Zymoseptoria tritici ST99CH_1E4]SMR63257.1 unnamed protein product [Zymoseptoria tritici ST99CH_3D1]
MAVNSPLYNCTFDTYRPALTNLPNCIMPNGHPRLNLCCNTQPAGNGSVTYQNPCSFWCELKGDGLPNDLQRARDAFIDCLRNGANASSTGGLGCSGGVNTSDPNGSGGTRDGAVTPEGESGGGVEGGAVRREACSNTVGMVFGLLVAGIVVGGM